MNEIQNTSDFIFYQGNDGNIKVQIVLGDETVWVTQKGLSEIFNVEVNTINYHLKEIFESGELQEDSTIRKIRIVRSEGNRDVRREVLVYNLDAIISVGYRVNSYQATQFRIWATSVLKEYMIKGFTLDDDRLKQGKTLFGKDYFDELLERIKEIRTSERRFYQKITDIYAQCSIDYDRQSPLTHEFYATVQNKLHFAVTHQTAAEIVSKRVDSKKKNMGLTTWKNAPKGKILKSDVSIAKNFLNEDELSELKDIVNFYLDFAELQAKRQKALKMSDWIVKLDDFLKFNDYDILTDAGKISSNFAKTKAESEFTKFRVVQDEQFVSDFDLLSSEIKQTGKLTTPTISGIIDKNKSSQSTKTSGHLSDFNKKLVKALNYDDKGKTKH